LGGIAVEAETEAWADDPSKLWSTEVEWANTGLMSVLAVMDSCGLTGTDPWAVVEAAGAGLGSEFVAEVVPASEASAPCSLPEAGITDSNFCFNASKDASGLGVAGC
jgi:hypothetical protein